MPLKMLLKGKPKTGVDEFCQQFYDSCIFDAGVAGTDFYSGFCEVSFNSVMEADQRFAAVDRALFRRELMAVHMELFGLAWMHCIKGEAYLLRQAAFTKYYLEQTGHPEIWDVMLEYNTAIARSLHEVIDSIPIKRLRLAKTVMVKKFIFDLFGKWVEAGSDESCAALILNRMFTDVAWNTKITLKHLTARYADRIKCVPDLHPEALFKLSVVMWGQYNGAKDAIKSVKLLL